MKLGTKILSGFSSILILAVVLGATAIFQMTSVGKKSTMLDQEYVPEVKIAGDLRGASNRVMYQMRGYGLTQNEKYLKAAKVEMKAVEAALVEAKALSERAINLKALSDQVKVAETAEENYHKAMNETEEAVKEMAKARQALDSNAALYINTCNEFLKGQNEKFVHDLADRDKKLTLIEKVADLGTKTRVLNLKGQAWQNREDIEKAKDFMLESKSPTDELIKICKDPKDVEAIKEIQKAAKAYIVGIDAYLKEEPGYQEKQNAAAKVWLEKVEYFLHGQRTKLVSDMKRRHALITIVNDIIDLGNDTRIKVFKAQALGQLALLDDANQNFPKIEEKFSDLKSLIADPTDLKRVATTQSAAHGYKDAIAQAQSAWKHLDQLAKERDTAGKALIAACKTAAEAGMKGTMRIASEASSSLGTASTVMVIGLIVAIILGLLASFTITRSITGPINRFIANLSEGAKQVSGASGQISSSSQSMASGASQQASSLEETSASLEQMTSMTQQNADNTKQASVLSEQASEAANRGIQSMDEMSSSIEKIKNSADETAKIISTIDEIAFQTNLLAINAAVEAARAGEAGKGFAVVADEVRNLAQRSAEAAKTTSEMISASQKNADEGVRVSTEVGNNLKEIQDSVTKVSSLSNEVAAASREQAQGIEQVNSAVTQMDKVTQQSAANAEQMAASAEELNAQSNQLESVVGDLRGLVGGGENQLQLASGATTAQLPASAERRQSPQLAASSGQSKVKKEEKVLPLGDEEFEDF